MPWPVGLSGACGRRAMRGTLYYMKNAVIQFRADEDLKQSVQATAEQCRTDISEVSRQALRLGLGLYRQRNAAAGRVKTGFGCVPAAQGDVESPIGWEGWQ